MPQDWVILASKGPYFTIDDRAKIDALAADIRAEVDDTSLGELCETYDRAENERLRGELKDIRATVGVAYAVLQSDYEPDPSECDTLLVHAALDMRAAAPDLLAALERLLPQLSHPSGLVYDHELEDIVVDARAAIAKAKGGVA